MKSSALIPFVVVMAAYSAQAAEQRKLTEPPVSHFRGTCESDPDGKKFAAKACYTSYYPGKQGYYRGYTPPTCDPKQEVTDAEGRKVFNGRQTHRMPFKMYADEEKFYKAVAAYIRDGYQMLERLNEPLHRRPRTPLACG